jgi:hypothetical protein
MTTTRKIFTDNLGGTEASSYIGRRGELFYNDNTGELRRSDGITPGGIAILTALAQGCFHKTVDVVADSSNTVYNFDWYTDTSVHLADGIIVDSSQPTRVVLSKAGNYTAFLEMQVKSTGTAVRDVFIWLAKNGIDIPETGVKIEIKGINNVVPVYQIIAKQWLIDDITAGDYIQLRFALSNHEQVNLEYSAAQTSPYVRPAVPSATFTIISV